MVPSGIDLGVTLTPPSPVPETAVIVDWCVPAGTRDVGAVDDELHDAVARQTITGPSAVIFCIQLSLIGDRDRSPDVRR
jgi:hypothetical protein